MAKRVHSRGKSLWMLWATYMSAIFDNPTRKAELVCERKLTAPQQRQGSLDLPTPQAIYKWQHGTAMPTIDNLVVLAAVLDVPMDEIIVIDVNRTKQISA